MNTPAPHVLHHAILAIAQLHPRRTEFIEQQLDDELPSVSIRLNCWNRQFLPNTLDHLA